MSGDPKELLLTYLPLIDRAIAFVSQRYRLTRAEAEEFSAIVRLRLIENDYAIVRAFEGRSSPATYFGIVVQRMLFDQRNKEWGKWRTSAEAKRLGPAAVELERLLHHDGLTLDEAFAGLQSSDRTLTRDVVEAMAARLPSRAPKRRDVSLDEAGRAAVIGSQPIEDEAAGRERRRVAERVSALVNEWIGTLPDDDCVLLQQRFGEGMSVAQIARATREDQKQLYRRMERRLLEVRTLIAKSGLDPAEVLDLIGRGDTILDFLLRRNTSRPSKERHEETAVKDPEEP